MKLTAAVCRDAVIGSLLRDDEVPGLQMRVRATKRTWHFYYRGRDGRERRPALGTFPGMSLGEARRAARDLRHMISTGRDPSAERRDARAEPTVEDLGAAYLAHCRPRVAGTTYVSYEYYVNTRILPAWGRRRVSTVTRDDVDRLVMSLEHSSGASEANHVRTQIRAMWNRGRALGMAPGENPVTGSYIAFEPKRERYATTEELQALFLLLRARQADRPAHVACIITLLVTGCRVGEVEQAQCRDWLGDRFEFDKHKTMRRTGARKVHYVHPAAAAMIDALPSARGKPSDRLFGTIKLRGFWRRLRADAGCSDLQLRDFRRTFASYGLTDEASLDRVSQLLGHTNRQTTMRYAHLLRDQRKGLTTDIADRLLRSAGGD